MWQYSIRTTVLTDPDTGHNLGSIRYFDTVVVTVVRSSFAPHATHLRRQSGAHHTNMQPSGSESSGLVFWWYAAMKISSNESNQAWLTVVSCYIRLTFRTTSKKGNSRRRAKQHPGPSVITCATKALHNHVLNLDASQLGSEPADEERSEGPSHSGPLPTCPQRVNRKNITCPATSKIF